MKKGLTIVEVLIVIIIIAILTAIAVPLYTNRIERTYGERAIANIEIIKDAWKMHRIKTEQPYFCTKLAEDAAFPNSDTGANSHLTEINQNLNLDLSDENFYYNINSSTVGFYYIDIIRVSGTYKNYKLCYTIALPDSEGWNTENIDIIDGLIWPWHPTQPLYEESFVI